MVQPLTAKNRPQRFIDQSLDLQHLDSGRREHLLWVAAHAADQKGAAVRQGLGHLLPALHTTALGRYGSRLDQLNPPLAFTVHQQFLRFTQMLIHQNAFHAGHRHARTRRHPFGPRLADIQPLAGLQGVRHFGVGGLTQQTDGIGTAARAVAHLFDVHGRCRADGLDRGLVRFGKMLEVGAGVGVVGHGVEQVDAQFGHACRHRHDVAVVDAGQDDAVGLDHDPPLLQTRNGVQLALQQDSSTGLRPDHPLAHAHP